ncbi:hypothetical protein X743_13105 [Mesorhizobium sp. LNHC252B00]|nr:hypothetical protein X743_13105 [Mesorhizobium sp. LNHC252B00]
MDRARRIFFVARRVANLADIPISAAIGSFRIDKKPSPILNRRLLEQAMIFRF